MSHYHHCVHEQFLTINDNTLNGLYQKMHCLMGAVSHLQKHCTHLEEVLRANGIAMPDNLINTPNQGAE